MAIEANLQPTVAPPEAHTAPAALPGVPSGAAGAPPKKKSRTACTKLRRAGARVIRARIDALPFA
jgi:hypothetical protein